MADDEQRVEYDQMALRLAFERFGRLRFLEQCPSCQFRGATPGTGAFSFDLGRANVAVTYTVDFVPKGKVLVASVSAYTRLADLAETPELTESRLTALLQKSEFGDAGILEAAEDVKCSHDSVDAYAKLIRKIRQGAFTDRQLFNAVRSRMVIPIQRYFHPEEFR